MKPERSLGLVVLFSLCLFQGCSSRGEAALNTTTSASSSDSQPTASEALIKVSPAEAANLRIEEVIDRPTARTLTTTGKIGFNEDRISHVVAPMSGYILDLKFKVGDPVKTGQTLAVLKSRELAEAVADLLSSRKDLDLAQKNYAMTADLFEHDATSKMNFQQVENDLAKARMQVEKNQEKLRLMGVPESDLAESNNRPIQPVIAIKSPIDGVVTERQATPGQYVAADGASLFTIADLSTVWVIGDVFEKDMHLLRLNQRAELITPAFPDHKFSARISRIDNVLDAASRTVKVRCVVANERGQLRPEMFATVNFAVSDLERAIDIPAQALLTESGLNFVYLSKGDNTFVRRKVDVQPVEGGQLRLIAGLKVGDRIVTDGTILLRGEEDKRGDQ
jgi:membrane fusion protein, heavy metal efflux system